MPAFSDSPVCGVNPECASASEDSREGGLCHRLDIETSGVLLAARTREAWHAMRAAFGGRDVDKRYLALVTTIATLTKLPTVTGSSSAMLHVSPGSQRDSATRTASTPSST